MNNLQPMKSFLELGRETLVSDGLVRKQSITSSWRTIQHIQERGTRRLLLVRYVGVPGNGVGALLEVIARSGVIGAAVNEMNFGVSLRCAGCWVDVVATEVGTEVEGFLDGEVGEVLVAEGDDFLLGDEEGEFVFSGVGEFAELDAVDFGADVGGQIGYFCALEKIGERRVCVFAVLVMLKGLEGSVAGFAVSDGGKRCYGVRLTAPSRCPRLADSWDTLRGAAWCPHLSVQHLR